MKRLLIPGLLIHFPLMAAEVENCSVRPVLARDFPDPYVLRVGGIYYGYSTNSNGVHVPVVRSRDRLHWEESGDALPELPAWAAPRGTRNWAPAALQVGETFILYYTTHYLKKGGQAISFAVSDSPAGPFVDSSEEPLIYQEEFGGSIDPEAFRDDDGSLYLLWKSDANSRGQPSALYIQGLESDGRTLRGEPVRLLAIDQEWEEPLIENPSMLRHDGCYYLIYSANWWESDRYAVGYATGPTPCGPFTKREEGPILQSLGEGERGPGGASFFRDEEGEPWIAYHAWSARATSYWAGGARSLRLAKVGFNEGRLRFYRWSGDEVEAGTDKNQNGGGAVTTKSGEAEER